MVSDELPLSWLKKKIQSARHGFRVMEIDGPATQMETKIKYHQGDDSYVGEAGMNPGDD